MLAYAALQTLRANPPMPRPARSSPRIRPIWATGCCCCATTNDPRSATPAQIERPPGRRCPNVPVLFWSFRIMVALGLFFIVLFATAFYLATASSLRTKPLVPAEWRFFSLPLPWIAAELGWIVAEYGRQPWAIDGVLPTFLGVSTTLAGNVIGVARRLRDFLHRRSPRSTCSSWCARSARTGRIGLLAGPSGMDRRCAYRLRNDGYPICLTTKRCA